MEATIVFKNKCGSRAVFTVPCYRTAKLINELADMDRDPLTKWELDSITTKMDDLIPVVKEVVIS